MIRNQDMFGGFGRVLAGCAVLAMLSGAALAKDSMEQLLKKVESGDAVAQFEVGERYLTGDGVDVSPTEAADWYLKAAEQGNVPAMGRLGSLLVQFGESAQVLNDGVQWLEKAVAAGDVDAMIALAKVEFAGKRPGAGEPDFGRILELLNAADAKGSAEAPVLLGGMYAEGRGVEKDAAKARALFERGIDAGSVEAMLALAAVYRQGLGVDEDPAKVIALYKQAVEAGSGVACRRLAVAAMSGYGMEKSPEEAYKWFEKGAGLNDPHSMRQVARYRMAKATDDKGKAAAFEMVRKAADLGDPAALYDLAAFYDEGIATPKDQARASELIYLAAINGVIPAQVEMGARYREGVGVTVRDFVAAAAWFSQAAGAGSGEAMYFLGVMHEVGEGVGAQPERAAELYKRAIARGVTDAHSRLGGLLMDGRGVERDPARAYAHFLIGAAARADGQQVLQRVEAQLTPEQKEAGRALVPELRKLGEAVNTEGDR